MYEQTNLKLLYICVMEGIRSGLPSRLPHTHEQSALDNDFVALIQPKNLHDEGGRLNGAAVDKLVTDQKKQYFFRGLPIYPNILIARIWGPFDHRGDPYVERVRETLFDIARDLQRTIQGSGSYPYGRPFSALLDIIFKSLDFADRCLHSEKARQEMADHIDHIRASCDLADCSVNSAEMQIVKAFAGMDALIAKLDKEKS